MKQVQIVRNKDVAFTLNLTDADKATGTQKAPIIPAGSVVEVHMQGDSGLSNKVIDSTGPATNNVVIADLSNGVLNCEMAASGTDLLKRGNQLPIEVLVKTPASGPVYSYIFSNGVAVVEDPVP